MILKLNDPRIQNLQKGEYAIPSLIWNANHQELGGYRFTVKARATSMRINGYGYILNNFDVSPTTPNEIEPVIMEKLNGINIENDNNLEEIYHLIQLWGGNSSRDSYLRYAKKFRSKLLENYKELVSKVINKNCKIEEITEACKKFSDATYGINISFITKHLRFWQKAFEFNNPLPIYDEIMAEYSMGKKTTNNEWKDLKIYWENMLISAQEIKENNEFENFSTWELERQLFIFFQDNPKNSGWSRTITKTKEKISKTKSIKTLNKKQSKKDKENDIKPPFVLKEKNSFIAIRINLNKSNKVGYIKKGWLHASEELKNLLYKYELAWEDASKDSGSKEKWKHKFDSEEDCIKFLKNKGIIKQA
jgi:uncharacterized protein (DUF1697 family)